MPTTRISEETRELLRRLSEEEDSSMQKIVEKALKEYRRKKFLEKSNEAYRELREREEEWSQEKKERKDWDATLEDGLDEGDRG